MDEIKLQKLISDYKSSHPQVKNKTDKEIISIMCNDPKVKKEDVAQLSILLANPTQQSSDSCNFSTKITLKPQTKSVIVKTKEGKHYDLNKTIELKLNNISAELDKTEKSNGFIGKAWSGFKNLTGIGDSSDEVRQLLEKERKLLNAFNSNTQKRPQIFKELTGVDYSPENLEKFIKGEIKLQSRIALDKYKDGQEMAVDVTSDIVSGVVAYGTAAACIAGGIAAAPFTAGASLGAVAVGVGIAAGAGAATKVALKAADAYSGGREYSWTEAGKDAVIGGVSGAIALPTMGTGGAVATTTAKVAPKVIANTARYSVEGAMFGAADGGTRAALEGESLEDIAVAAGEGALGGAIVGNVMGHGGSAISKVYSSAKGLLKGAEDAVPTPTPKQTRAELKEKLASGQKLNTQDVDFKIPAVKFAAPSSKFAETDEAFRNIVRNHTQEFLELNKKSGDDFIKEAFRLCKKYMGLEDAPIGLEIGNWASSEADAANAVIRISRNWGNGDKAELLGAVAHELDHMFQYKEMHINSVLDDVNFNIKPEFKHWIENQAEFLTNHNQYYYDKGHVYSENFANYIEPHENLGRYRSQPVEAEAFRRGDLVKDEFKNLLSSSGTRNSVKLDAVEQEACNKILNYLVRKYPQASQSHIQEVIDDAITTMRQPEFVNMHYEQFVNYFISLY